MDRAMQFLPFNSLEGYYEMLDNSTFQKQEKKELTEDELADLNDKMSQIKEGMMVKIKYYKIDGYIETIGMVSFVDKALKTIRIIKTKISFKDILNIEIINLDK